MFFPPEQIQVRIIFIILVYYIYKYEYYLQFILTANMNMNIICMEYSQTYSNNLATLWLSTGPDQSIFFSSF